MACKVLLAVAGIEESILHLPSIASISELEGGKLLRIGRVDTAKMGSFFKFHIDVALRNLYELRKTNSIHLNSLLPLKEIKEISNRGYAPIIMNSNTSVLPPMIRFTSSVARLVKIGLVTFASAVLVTPVVQATGLVIDTNTLTIAPTGKLDIESNALIVHSTPHATIRGYVVLGNNGGDWLGKGVTSSVAAAEAANFLTTVGLIDNSDPFAGYTTFVGHPVNPTASLAKYTYFGDADLNGLVDSTDYFFIDNGFGTAGSATPLKGWINGDFDYSGAVDSTDYFYIDNAFGLQGAPILPAPPLAGAAVPEPSSFGLILLGLGVVANRRRK